MTGNLSIALLKSEHLAYNNNNNNNKYEKNYEVILMRRFFHPCFSRFF